MKVYVVESDVYEQRHIAGIYSTPEAAQRSHPAPGTPGGPELRSIPGEQIDPTPDRRREGGWARVEGWPGEWWNGFGGGWHEWITEYEVVS